MGENESYWEALSSQIPSDPFWITLATSLIDAAEFCIVFRFTCDISVVVYVDCLFLVDELHASSVLYRLNLLQNSLWSWLAYQ